MGWGVNKDDEIGGRVVKIVANTVEVDDLTLAAEAG